TFPLLAAFPNELAGAHAPVGIAMIAGAFVFGTAMQLVMGCGSGVLINAGSGNLIGALALVGFIAGSFLGGEHLHWWVALGVLPVYSLQGLFGDGAGLALTLLGLGLIAVLVIWRAEPGKRLPAGRSEEHTSELQSRENLVCRLLLEKKKKHTQAQRARGQHTT